MDETTLRLDGNACAGLLREVFAHDPTAASGARSTKASSAGDRYRSRIADEAGFDHCWAFDHLVTMDADGTDLSVFEGWSLLGAMAEATRRTRIGLLVTGMVFRHRPLLAKPKSTGSTLPKATPRIGSGPRRPHRRCR